MKTYLTYLYLLSPLHTGGASQEGNLVGLAREVHTDLPYLPSSTIRGRLRAATPEKDRTRLWGNTIEDVTSGTDENLKQGTLWVGDAAILWFPVPSLSHGVVWVTSPFLLQRWARCLDKKPTKIPEVLSFSGGNSKHLYLKDAIFKKDKLKLWSKEEWSQFLPNGSEEIKIMTQFLVLSNQNCQVLIESSLWRQVKVRLDETKTVKGGFRYEEAVPPETLMYFPWSSTVSANGQSTTAINDFKSVISGYSMLQLGGQESLGRGFVRQWLSE
ncbi:type III-B CRISPR module RAMP protein Cmr4 [Scytonema sp. NUACC21]